MATERVVEVIHAFGHPNIRSTHPTTLMTTKERHLTAKGDCIIAVGADKAVADLSLEFKEILRKPNAKLTVKIEVDDSVETVNAYGAPELTLSHPNDLVIRKSEFISNRTLAVKADKASCDLSRAMVEKLKTPKQQVTLTLIVEV